MDSLPSIITLVPTILCIGYHVSLVVFFPISDVKFNESALELAFQAIILLNKNVCAPKSLTTLRPML